jgi:hypothetical protein
MKRIYLLISIFLLIFAAGCGLQKRAPLSVTTEIPYSVINEKLSKALPIKQRIDKAGVELLSALVSKASDGKEGEVEVRVSFLFKSFTVPEGTNGVTTLHGVLRVNEHDGQLYLYGLKNGTIEFVDNSIKRYISQKEKEAIFQIAAGELSLIPLYHLQKSPAAPESVKAVVAKEKKIVVIFGA